MKIPKDYRISVVLKPKETKKLLSDAFRDYFYVVEEIHAIWQPDVEIFFYFDSALWDIFGTSIPFPDRGFYRFSKVFRVPLIVQYDMEVVARNNSNSERQIEIIIDGYLAPKEKYRIKT